MKQFILILVILSLSLLGCEQREGYSTHPLILDDAEQECARVNGEWVEFPDTCVDSCEKIRAEGLMCGQAMTMGCECGPDKCWNGQTCESN